MLMKHLFCFYHGINDLDPIVEIVKEESNLQTIKVFAVPDESIDRIFDKLGIYDIEILPDETCSFSDIRSMMVTVIGRIVEDFPDDEHGFIFSVVGSNAQEALAVGSVATYFDSYVYHEGKTYLEQERFTMPVSNLKGTTLDVLEMFLNGDFSAAGIFEEAPSVKTRKTANYIIAGLLKDGLLEVKGKISFSNLPGPKESVYRITVLGRMAYLGNYLARKRE